MIQEVIVTTQSLAGVTHIAPMGVHICPEGFSILPFRPSTTLDNLLTNPVAVLNYCDDVRVFAGCLTGRRNWPLRKAEKIQADVLACALAHTEVQVVAIQDDAIRPNLICQPLYSATHAPFVGFNRAQFAVLEAAILVSRLDRLPLSKIDAELAYLRIGFEKTAGEREQEAWAWLMAAVEAHKNNEAVL